MEAGWSVGREDDIDADALDNICGKNDRESDTWTFNPSLALPENGQLNKSPTQ